MQRAVAGCSPLGFLSRSQKLLKSHARLGTPLKEEHPAVWVCLPRAAEMSIRVGRSHPSLEGSELKTRPCRVTGGLLSRSQQAAQRPFH